MMMMMMMASMALADGRACVPNCDLPMLDGVKYGGNTPPIHYSRVTFTHGQEEEFHDLVIAFTGTQMQSCVE